MLATESTVVRFLVEEAGILEAKAWQLVEDHADLVKRGEELQSFDYYVAGEIVSAEAKKLGFDELPSDWDGWDTNWEPEDEHSEDD